MEDEKLERMFELTEENNRMLHTMRRNAMVGGALKVVFWAIVLVGIPYYVWLYVQPYLQKAESAYASAQHTSQSVSDSPITKFFEQFGSGSAK